MIKELMTLIPAIAFSALLQAGAVTIEKSDSLIRNDIFDEKRERAEDYQRRKVERNANNESWSSQIPLSCGLLKDNYLIYFCASNGRYYKGYESGNKPEYRELSSQEVKKIHNAKD